MTTTQTDEATRVILIDGPIAPESQSTFTGCGAVVHFDGVVRPDEDGKPLNGLHYTSYDPMAEQELRRIAKQAMKQYAIKHVHITHSRGLVLAGQASLRLVVASAHRKPALAAIDFILDALKCDVPIWKAPVFDEDGERS